MDPSDEPVRSRRDRQRAVRRAASDDPVDLSPVGPYVREAETQLERVMAAAEEQEAVLLLDEADALVARRTDVADAHDRYAG